MTFPFSIYLPTFNMFVLDNVFLCFDIVGRHENARFAMEVFLA